ncbi:hypothetical protein WQQ_25570 [Hydrocarboniphaga effusa AP103]|uniref:Uncharacterized protein n=1 Tax=Hydrocarboniphaga effusa AP103 TaxID=1172194 RepID=I8T507_9GAMM|nr:hypothetical protein WQQ_25570 [Hydrocarboniphaga effusa AP103]
MASARAVVNGELKINNGIGFVSSLSVRLSVTAIGRSFRPAASIPIGMFRCTAWPSVDAIPHADDCRPIAAPWISAGIAVWLQAGLKRDRQRAPDGVGAAIRRGRARPCSRRPAHCSRKRARKDSAFRRSHRSPGSTEAPPIGTSRPA